MDRDVREEVKYEQPVEVSRWMDYKMTRESPVDTQILSSASNSVKKSDYSLMCVFTDTTLCHRFIRILIPEAKREKAEEAINDFLRELYE